MLSLHNPHLSSENHQQGQIDAPSCAKISNYESTILFHPPLGNIII
jgi:hypothetical protein